mmetsp:Transcript_29854/g.44131  ORF Transcript_29854/g.44131 Transcript_29854/m.44131 type:complete len:120 (-) Transcript_29854:479-838(-)
MTRGQNCYYLPLGPLPLLPPMVLQSLALQVNERNKASQQKLLPNRCVTVWIYLDERTGQILDAGVERTLIGSPAALTYSKATHLLEQPPLPASSECPLSVCRCRSAVHETGLHRYQSTQ